MDNAEIYARRIAQTGYFASESPTDYLLPGDYGFFDHSVFHKMGSLDQNGYAYTFQAIGAGQKALMSSGMFGVGIKGGADASDPLGIGHVGANVTYRATRANEALLLMKETTAWTIGDVEGLLRQIQSKLGTFRLNTVIVNSVTATDGGVRLISSSAGQSIDVEFTAGSTQPTVTIDGQAAIQLGRTSSMGVVDSFWAPNAAQYRKQATIPPDAGQACMPVFRSGFRVQHKQWHLLGRGFSFLHGRELDTLTGQEVLVYPADHELGDFVPGRRSDEVLDEVEGGFGNSSLGPTADPGEYQINRGELADLDVWDIFEAVGPVEIVNEFDLLTNLQPVRA